MVTFMKATHKRKSNGVFVCKKAELIAKKCRNMEHQILSQRDNDDDDTLETNHLTQKEFDAIYQGTILYMCLILYILCEVTCNFEILRNSMEESQEIWLWSNSVDPTVDTSPNYEEMYLETQEKLQKSDQVIKGMLLKFKDVDFWKL
ncbi:T32E20.24 [Arabidopsis thaliana]|uniref:T32E20.24 n=1 Tax=Arabidopsis thaliana TaxID=3702 RepID=Q9LP96_ARATH|nr:T32E20.24 [Arabidopsis thaliana]